MGIIKGTSKRGQELLAKARRNEGTELRHVYGRWSEEKESAMRKCWASYVADDGENFRIISHCRDSFSVAWEFPNKETGETMTRIETFRNTYIIDGSRVEEE